MHITKHSIKTIFCSLENGFPSIMIRLKGKKDHSLQYTSSHHLYPSSSAASLFSSTTFTALGISELCPPGRCCPLHSSQCCATLSTLPGSCTFGWPQLLASSFLCCSKKIPNTSAGLEWGKQNKKYTYTENWAKQSNPQVRKCKNPANWFQTYDPSLN